MSDKQFKFEADTGKILNIVINSLYSQREIFLRELISNASDAINKRKFETLKSGGSDDTFVGAIGIAVDKKARIVTISDNGIGLTSDEMVATLGTIASSGTKAFIERVDNNDDGDIGDQLIGQFGVGLLGHFSSPRSPFRCSVTRVGLWRWCAIGIGFVGMLTVMKPFGTVFPGLS